MSRAAQNLERKMEAERRARLSAGAEKIAADPDCRFLIRTLLEQIGALENCGMGVNGFAPNALTTAHETGKIATGQLLITLISTHVAHFYPDLLKETANEHERNAARLATAGSGLDRSLDGTDDDS